MNDIKGKKLLILGGVKQMCEIVKEAHKMGVTVYVTDYLEDSPAKKIADKSFMVNAMDVDAVVKLCKDEGIDGLITGYVDSLLPYAEAICRKAGLPFWGNAENIEMCINKDLFKDACEKAGLTVVPGKTVTRKDYKNASDISFPVVIKPVDNSGARGVYKCYSPDDYEDYCEKAFGFSKCGELLVEKLMPADSEFSTYYMFCKGKALFAGMSDRYVKVVDESIAPVSQGAFMPSPQFKKWEERVHPLIQKFASQNDMKDGFAFFQGFYSDDEFYISEIGYRLIGGFSFKLIEHFSDYNQVQELINYCLTGEMDEKEVTKSNPDYNGCGFIVTFALKQGTIGAINGVDEIRKLDGVVDFIQMHEIGDTISATGTTSENFGYALCAGENLEALQITMTKVENTLKILDADGNDMLWAPVDPQRIVC